MAAARRQDNASQSPQLLDFEDRGSMIEHLAVTICATEKYQYAMSAQARAIHANLRHLEIPISIILVGDAGLRKKSSLYADLFSGVKERVTIELIEGFEPPAGENYKNEAQLLIAQMRTAAFQKARIKGATLCWSLDSDVIPKTSSCYATLRWILDIPDRFYEVAISPYPSQGGGDLLTGRGTPENPISQDFKREERNISEDLKNRMAAHDEAMKAIRPPNQPTKELVDEANAINKLLGEMPPLGNVFEMNARHGWRRRGWLSASYPGLGRGTIVPTDWCGFGSTLMGRRALDECDFLGYEGAGTEDLFIVWTRWHQAGIRIGSALHEPSSHVSRRSDGKYFVASIRFVTDADETKGECVGHLRIIHKPFYAHDRGEKFDKDNDGMQIAPAERAKMIAAMAAREEGKEAVKPADIKDVVPAYVPVPMPAEPEKKAPPAPKPRKPKKAG